MNSQTQADDLSNGYEEKAATFIAGRNSSEVGAATVREWAQTLPPGAALLDLGCGSGVPISQALIENGFEVYGVDASVSMTNAFHQRFPQAQVACEAVEHSSFFGRKFAGVVSWGLFFLLPAATQLALIPKIAEVLVTGGRFLFTAPWQIGDWNDNLTGRPSQSLGREAYTAALTVAGLRLVGEYCDEGENHYYDAVKE
jgi:2-polyprenyl-3-methyl-5-hydroxy-6-metoxy-1,4-benzoquinol methylase